jgi:hypothetical protein
MRWRAFLLALILLAAPSCGSSGGAGPVASGEDVICGPSMYILDGGCVNLPAFSDAGGPYDDGEDAGVEGGEGGNPGSDAEAGAALPDGGSD